MQKIATIFIITTTAIIIPWAVYLSIQIIKPAPAYPGCGWQDNLSEEERVKQQKLCNEYEKARTEYSKIYFFTSASISIAIMLIAILLPIHSLMIGMSTGGFIGLVHGIVYAWGYYNDVMRLFFILLAFIIIAFFAYLLHRQQQKLA